VRGGPKLNHAVLCALMSNKSAWTFVEDEPVVSRGHAEIATVQAAFGPDLS
jgi:hypothetical protein